MSRSTAELPLELSDVTVDGHCLVVARQRAPEPRGSVVLLHGGGQTRHAWAATTARLGAQGWTTVVYDARGHGDSDWSPTRDYSPDAQLRDLRAVLAGFVTDAPVLVGASMGGIVALLAAAGGEVAVRGVVLVDIVPKIEESGAKRIVDFMAAAADGFGSLEEVAAAIRSSNPQRRRAVNLSSLRKNVRQRANGRWYWHWDPAILDHRTTADLHDPRARLLAAAAQIRIPTLIVTGTGSDIVSDEGVAEMLRLVPHARAVRVSGAVHMVVGDDNGSFSSRVSEWLDEEWPISS
ncbi:MAG TPA: alpha/beta hydrolase [Sporichthyaceae bacterium]|jgi:pimeloyl-ACP methyl ester carboxylesterase|nr:alpha/beta hydrolase [Sporichthyaceae bacterium]